MMLIVVVAVNIVVRVRWMCCKMFHIKSERSMECVAGIRWSRCSAVVSVVVVIVVVLSMMGKNAAGILLDGWLAVCVASLQCVDSVTLLLLSLLISLLHYYYYYIMMMIIIIITISIDPYEYHMDNESCSSGGLSLVAKPSLRCTGTLSNQQTSNHDKNFIVGHYMQTVQPTLFSFLPYL